MNGPGSDVPSNAGNSKNLRKLERLVSGVRQGSLDAGGELFSLVMASAQPYLGGSVQLEDIEPQLEDVVSVVWDSIRDGALLRAEFLPAFIETLIWQQVRSYLLRTGQPVPGSATFKLIQGGRENGTSTDPVLAPQ